MAGVNKVVTGDNDVYEATEVVEGGQLVVPADGATLAGKQGVAVAASGATDVLGVAARRAEPVADQNQSGTDSDGYDVTYVTTINELTTVYKHAVVPVGYLASAVGFGAKLVAATGGKVKAFTSGTDDASLIVGECRVVGGMGSGGGTGLALIY